MENRTAETPATFVSPRTSYGEFQEFLVETLLTEMHITIWLALSMLPFLHKPF